MIDDIWLFFFFKQKTAYEMLRSLVGSEMCIRDRYCAPRSEWKITPAGGLRLAIAISKAAVPSSVRIWSAMAHPTSLREYKSITVATYAQPSHVFTYVISPHHFSLGRSAQKDRPIRSGAGTGLSPPMVVRFHAFGWRPRRPATFMRRQTRLRDSRCPKAARPAWRRRTPGFPRASAWSFFMIAIRVVSSFERWDGAAVRHA